MDFDKHGKDIKRDNKRMRSIFWQLIVFLIANTILFINTLTLHQQIWMPVSSLIMEIVAIYVLNYVFKSYHANGSIEGFLEAAEMSIKNLERLRIDIGMDNKKEGGK